MSNETLRGYLLGTLTEPESEELEERLLDDEELFQTLRSVEDDLIDDFARGKLDESARQAFQDRYGGQKSRVTFAKALARRTTNVVPLARPSGSRRAWIALAIAATLAVVVGGLVVTRVEETSNPTPTPIARRRATPPYPVVLALAASRSAGGPTAITIPPAFDKIQLRVRLDPNDRFERYDLELKSAAGVIWRAENLKATSEGEELTLSAEMPARLLPDGSYELAVRGDSDALGFVVLEVHR